MTQTFEIPLRPMAQTLSVQLGSKVYELRLIWCDAGDQSCWILDIADDAGNALLSGVPLVCGGDLFEQFPDMAFGGKLFCGHDGDLTAPPLFVDLGETSHLFWQPD